MFLGKSDTGNARSNNVFNCVVSNLIVSRVTQGELVIWALYPHLYQNSSVNVKQAIIFPPANVQSLILYYPMGGSQ